MVIRVIIVDDQAIVRAGVGAMLAGESGYEVVASVEDGRLCQEAVRLHRPDVLFLDLNMPNLHGLELLKALKHSTPGLKVIVLTAQTDGTTVQKALQAGAEGFVSKDLVTDELIYALRTVLSGRVYISSSVSMLMSQAETPPPVRVDHEAVGHLVELSPRQVQVLQGVAMGKSNKEMARDMGISIKTVEYHRAEVMHRTQMHDVAGLTRYALRWYPPQGLNL